MVIIQLRHAKTNCCACGYVIWCVYTWFRMCLLKVVFLVWFCVVCTFRCFNTHFNAHMIRGMVLILTSDMVFDRGGIPSRKSKQHPYQIISSKRIKNSDPKHKIIISNSYKPVWRNVPKPAEDNWGQVLDSFTLSHPQKSLNGTVTGVFKILS